MGFWADAEISAQLRDSGWDVADVNTTCGWTTITFSDGQTYQFSPYICMAELVDHLKETFADQRSRANSGRKDDGDKHCRPDLIPPHAEEEVAKVLDFGARKYGDDNWRKVENAKTRYLAAARRHLIQYKKGETADPDSKLHPLAHAICSLLFVLELELEASNEK